MESRMPDDAPPPASLTGATPPMAVVSADPRMLAEMLRPVIESALNQEGQAVLPVEEVARDELGRLCEQGCMVSWICVLVSLSPELLVFALVSEHLRVDGSRDRRVIDLSPPSPEAWRDRTRVLVRDKFAACKPAREAIVEKWKQDVQRKAQAGSPTPN